MQTFLPSQDFLIIANQLDWRRHNKQITEVQQMLNAIEGKTTGWINHPATQQWKNNIDLLKLYHDVLLWKWYKNGRGGKREFVIEGFDINQHYNFPKPSWWSDERVFSSHRSNLLRKDSVHYGQFGWTEDDKQDYFWPTKNGY